MLPENTLVYDLYKVIIVHDIVFIRNHLWYSYNILNSLIVAITLVKRKAIPLFVETQKLKESHYFPVLYKTD